jgi:hypothetical protein
MAARSYIRPVPVNESSPFLGDSCALCKETFAVDDKLVICPQDGSRHHLECWEANGNRCTAFGCEGSGEILPERREPAERYRFRNAAGAPPVGRFSKVRTLPSSSMGCAQSCLVLSIALAIVLIAAGCFGLWAVADYILMEVLGWQYRTPFTGSLTLPAVAASLGAFRYLVPL